MTQTNPDTAAESAAGRAGRDLSGLDQAGLIGQDDGLAAAGEVELGQDPRDMSLDRGLADRREVAYAVIPNRAMRETSTSPYTLGRTRTSAWTASSAYTNGANTIG